MEPVALDGRRGLDYSLYWLGRIPSLVNNNPGRAPPPAALAAQVRDRTLASRLHVPRARPAQVRDLSLASRSHQPRVWPGVPGPTPIRCAAFGPIESGARRAAATGRGQRPHPAQGLARPITGARPRA